MTALIDHMIAYYVAGQAAELSVAPRFYPYGELQLIFEDKISLPFASSAEGAQALQGSRQGLHRPDARNGRLVDHGGRVRRLECTRFQADRFRAVIREEQDANPIILRSQSRRPGLLGQGVSANWWP
ncbi:MAG: hypothetical protein QM808_06200 [Steroidobacteraceae bacterium]